MGVSSVSQAMANQPRREHRKLLSGVIFQANRKI